MYYGVSWYPEQKAREEWQHDIKLLADSGFNVVRMGEFAWTEMEPTAGVYNFNWLIEAVEALAEVGIKSIICTPTACPPAWMVENNPQLRYVDNNGRIRPYGGRRTYCYSNQAYREASAGIAARLAEVFGRHPAVIGYQIDNEPAQEATGRCHCPVCQAGFRAWLKQRFGTIDKLNTAAGMKFWNQTYDSFEQIELPVNSIEVGTNDAIRAYYENPSLRLWAEQFASEQQIEYQNIQTRAMRPYTDLIITVNGTGLATNSIDYYKAYEELDVYAFDYYPSLRHSISPAAYAHARGIKNKPFWLMEFVSGGGHRLSGSGRSQAWPGSLQQSVVHAAACGAELIAHFQFRTFAGGAEQLNYAIVDADGVARRRYYECRDTARILRKLEPILSAEQPVQRVALIFDYESLWSLKIKPVHEGHDYLKLLEEMHANLAKLGVQADIIGYENLKEDASKYQAIILGCQILTDDETRQVLRDYVSAGGNLIAGTLTSVKNRDNYGYTESLPAGLTDVFGLHVAEVDPVFDYSITPIRSSAEVASTTGDADYGSTRYWCEALALDSAQPLLVFDGSFRDGVPLAAKNSFGQGSAWYIGTSLASAGAQTMLADILKECGMEILSPDCRVPEGMQVVDRITAESKYKFIFNFLEVPSEMFINGSWELIAQTDLAGTAECPEISATAAAVNQQAQLIDLISSECNGTQLKLGPCHWAVLRAK
ncbi:MAG: beta-galactosidase [Eubacteriales bacterium]|nr:beta-galactosidase [Eubacteriales bacterium]